MIKSAVNDNLTTLGQFFMPVFGKVLGLIRDGVNYSIEFVKRLYASTKSRIGGRSLLIGSWCFILKAVWKRCWVH